MQRYFFDLQNGDGFTKDDEGRELPSRKAINLEIAKILLDVAQDEMGSIDHMNVTVTVRDDAGKTVSLASLTMNNIWTAE